MLKFLLEKEFKQIMRNKSLPRMVIVMPFMALALFPLVANFDVRNINLSVVDNNHSPYSERLIQKVVSSGYFQLTNVSDRADVVLEIPPRFEEELMTNQTTNVLISANTVNGMKGGLSSAYLVSILNDFGTEVRTELINGGAKLQTPSCEIVPRYYFNPHLEYKYTMIPAIMMMMLAMLTGFLPALNIVGEKEKGTIEQKKVSPVGKFSLILSKLIPFVLSDLLCTFFFLLPGFLRDDS
jgi:ABC-2 type transport system permease protein